jgi:hypothetical protein
MRYAPEPCWQRMQYRIHRPPFLVATADENPPANSYSVIEHDPEKCAAVFPRDKRGTRLRGDHAQSKA